MSLNAEPSAAHSTPTLPEGWTKCHAYMERKKRFCRQQVHSSCDNDNKGPRYCGNHLHLLISSNNSKKRQRVPCPVDPSHLIYQDKIEQHVSICPARKRMKETREQPYYHQDLNRGGYGDKGAGSFRMNDLDWAKKVALRVLQVHQMVFTGKHHTPEEISKLTLGDVRNAIETLDLSNPEFEAKLESSVEEYRIRTGGRKHLHQQASLLGHLKRIRMLADRESEVGEETISATNTILELGAGRGMTGLLAAGVAAAQSSGNVVQLVLVERSGSRSKADTVLRNAVRDGKKEGAVNKKQDSFMALGNIQWRRIQCDLAHVDMANVLTECRQNDSGVIAIAKHLCGVGTDLALKSLVPVRDRLSTCLMATCCHGVCAWDDYVARDYLTRLMTEGEASLKEFGGVEFALLSKWSAGTVADNCKEIHTDNGADKTVEEEEQHCQIQRCEFSEDDSSDCNVSRVAKALGLCCGVQGLGRACQRVIDLGRKQFLQETLFPGNKCELMYYVSDSITPQNAALVGHRVPR